MPLKVQKVSLSWTITGEMSNPRLGTVSYTIIEAVHSGKNFHFKVTSSIWHVEKHKDHIL